MFAYVTGTLRYVLQNHNQDSYHPITPFLRVLRLFPSKLSKISHLPWELNFSAKLHFSDSLSATDIISRRTKCPKGFIHQMYRMIRTTYWFSLLKLFIGGYFHYLTDQRGTYSNVGGIKHYHNRSRELQKWSVFSSQVFTQGKIEPKLSRFTQSSKSISPLRKGWRRGAEGWYRNNKRESCVAL